MDFSCMTEYTFRKDKELAKGFSTIPHSATYMSRDIQNEIIGLIGEIVTEEATCEKYFDTRVQSAQKKHTTPEDSSTNPTGGVLTRRFFGRME